MATYAQTPGLLNIKAVTGTDFSCQLDFDTNLSAYTFDAAIVLQEYPSKREQAITITVDNAAQGIITLSLTDTQTSALGAFSKKKWYLNWNISGIKQTILAGLFELSDIPLGQNEVTSTGITINTQSVDITLSAFSNAALDGKQPLNAALTQISGLSPNNNDFLQRKSGAWTNRSIAQVKTDLDITNVDNTSDLNKPLSNATTLALSYKVNTNQISAFGYTLIDDADASEARTTLGLGTAATEPSSSFQPTDSDLTAIAALTPSNDDFLQRKAGAWTNRSIAQVSQDLGVGNKLDSSLVSAYGLNLIDSTDAADARTTLALGTISTQNANNVSITGGTISGITDISLADGGTNNSLTAVNGGVVYSTASQLAITNAGTNGQYLRSNGPAAPTWEPISAVAGAAIIFNDDTTNREYYPVFSYQAAGTSSFIYGSTSKLNFNPSNGYFTSTRFIGDLTGSVTGVASGNLALSTSTYVIVPVSSSATTNGTALRNAYAAAKLLTPNSLPLSATNRATVLIPPGRYDLATTPLTMDTEFVDLVGLSEEPKHVFITSQVILSDSGTIVQTADNVVIRNVSIDRTGNPAGSGAGRTAAYFPNRTSTAIQSWTSNGTLATVTSNGHGLLQGDSVRITGSGNTSFDGAYTVTNVIDLNSFQFASTVNSSGLIGTATERFDDTYIENCRFSGTTDSGMRGAVEYAGTYRKCIGGNESFGGAYAGSGVSGAIASGLFEDCFVGSGSFGLGIASGTFTRCTAGNGSFGGIASGIFTDCSALGVGFATPSGNFLRCRASDLGFGSELSTANGTLTDCELTISSSGGYSGTFSGTMRRCRFVATLGNASPIKVVDGAKIFDSTFIAAGAGNSITANSPATISLAGCRMNRDINANVSNNLGTLTESYNLIDADIT